MAEDNPLQKYLRQRGPYEFLRLKKTVRATRAGLGQRNGIDQAAAFEMQASANLDYWCDELLCSGIIPEDFKIRVKRVVDTTAKADVRATAYILGIRKVEDDVAEKG